MSILALIVTTTTIASSATCLLALVTCVDAQLSADTEPSAPTGMRNARRKLRPWRSGIGRVLAQAVKRRAIQLRFFLAVVKED